MEPAGKLKLVPEPAGVQCSGMVPLGEKNTMSREANLLSSAPAGRSRRSTKGAARSDAPIPRPN
jgi:hypothetical protein